jgi:RNA polymerase sigma-70 factor (ECF subfamily)
MYQMARNVHIDHTLQQKKKLDRMQTLDQNKHDCPETNDGFKEEEYDRLNQSLLLLSQDQREIIILSRFQGLKYEEISKIRHISVSAIKVQVFRAVKQLREIYFRQQ